LGGFREGGCYSTKSTKIGETQSKTKGNYGDWGGGEMPALLLDPPLLYIT